MNGFLKSQGYSKAAQFDSARPAESLSFLADAVFKRQFGLKVNSATYIKPAMAYLQVRTMRFMRVAVVQTSRHVIVTRTSIIRVYTYLSVRA